MEIRTTGEIFDTHNDGDLEFKKWVSVDSVINELNNAFALKDKEKILSYIQFIKEKLYLEP